MALDSKKVYSTTTVDPNFSLPPGVIDVEYRDPDDAGESRTDRSAETGQVINVDYDEVTYGESGGEQANVVASVESLYPPDSITVVSQEVRITTDGRAVVDIILDVPDAAAGITYDVRITKA